MNERPDRVVMGLTEILTEVAALYAVVHEALRVSVKISGVDLQALVIAARENNHASLSAHKASHLNTPREKSQE